MSKVICDICGTTYQDTADCCPICGCSRDIAAELAKEDFLVEETPAAPRGKGRQLSSDKKREIFDYDEVNNQTQVAEDDDYPYDGEADDEDEPSHNTFLVILLTVLIVALLAVTGFLFVKFFMPNMFSSDEETTPVTETQTVQETQTETTELRIPCESLSRPEGGIELSHEGQYALLNVVVTPEDTTDDVVYSSADESVATVSEDGRVTAVGEGQTVISIFCGDKELSCPVSCVFVEDTEPTTEATEATEAEVEETEAVETKKPDVVLKLKKSDIRLGVYLSFTLELDCDLDPTDVEWSSEHPYIATVDENGMVTAIKSGTTSITAKYGDQEVSCIVRCFVPG